MRCKMVLDMQQMQLREQKAGQLRQWGSVVLLGMVLSVCYAGGGRLAKGSRPEFTTLGESSLSLQLYAAEIVPMAATEVSRSDASRYEIRIVNLGPPVNTEYLEYAPVISADGRVLYFVSNRPGSIQNPDGEYSHDFWAAYCQDNARSLAFQRPYNLDPHSPFGEFGLNTWRNEGVMTITADQQMIFFTACDRPDGIGSCDIYVVRRYGGRWGKPRNLGPNVNTAYWESQPSISADGTRLYFASDRPGGQGGVDIWYSDYDFVLGEWSPARNLGPVVNTASTDWSPFIAADGRTLIFSSDGHQPNLGGLDFYYTRWDDNTGWSTPVNLGPPINTAADEAFLSMSSSGDVVFFASKRTDIPGYQGDFDIFAATIPAYFDGQKRPSSSPQLVVEVKWDCTDKDAPAKVVIYNPVTRMVIEDSVDGVYKTQVRLPVQSWYFGSGGDTRAYVQLMVSAFSPFNEQGAAQTVILYRSAVGDRKVRLFLQCPR